MKAVRTPLLIALIAATLLGVLLPAPAHAYTVPVFDYVNWFLSYYQRYQQIANQIEQLRRQAQQIEIALRTLERFKRGGDWASLQGLFGNLQVLFNSAESLGYLYSQVQSTWDATFPGYFPPLQSWPVDQEARVRRTFATLRQIELGLHQVAELNDASEASLALLRARADSADTPQKQLEMHSMFLDFEATETSRSMQANLLAANAITVLGAEQLQRAATADLARNTWVDQNAPQPPADFEAMPGYTGVPRDRPWTISF